MEAGFQERAGEPRQANRRTLKPYHKGMKNKIAITELIPANGRKSFYGKAKVIDDGKVKYLLSYETVMASVDGDGAVRRHSDFRSKTTDEHVKSFLYSFSNMDTETFRKLPVVDRPVIKLEI